MSRRIAIVTGASRGIGRAIAVRLAGAGFDTALAARSVGDLETVRDECAGLGARALAHRTDVSSESDVAALFEATSRELGEVDLLVNNAGIGIYGPVAETSVDDWDRMMSVNLRGTFLCSRAAMRAMTPRRSGTIVNISSVVGLKGYANQGGYAASKHGIVGLSKVLAVEGAEHGIRVHAICPGGVDTDMVSLARPDIRAEDMLQPEDVADLVVYLVNLPGRAMIDIVHLRRSTSSPY